MNGTCARKSLPKIVGVLYMPRDQRARIFALAVRLRGVRVLAVRERAREQRRERAVEHGEAPRQVRVDRQVLGEVVPDRVRVVAGARGEEAVGELDPARVPTVTGDRDDRSPRNGMRLGTAAGEVVRLVPLAVGVDVAQVDLAVDLERAPRSASGPARGTARRLPSQPR